MRPSDFIRTGIINLSRRRVRTSLTALSMAIGVMCILMLVSVGIGYEQAYRESIEAMGSLTKIDVTQKNGSNGKIAILNKKAVAAFKGIDGVEAVTPVLQSTAYLKSGKYITMVKLYGIDMDTAACFGIAPIEGELPKKGTRLMPELMATDDLAASFAEPDTWKEAIDRNGKPLIDLMRANVKMTFDYASLVGDYTEGEDGRAVPLGQSLRASVTGICSAMNYTYSCSAFLHMDTLKAIAGNSNAAADKNAAEYPLVWVKVGDADDVMEIASLIRSAGFETYSLTDMLESVKDGKDTGIAVRNRCRGAAGCGAMHSEHNDDGHKRTAHGGWHTEGTWQRTSRYCGYVPYRGSNDRLAWRACWNRAEFCAACRAERHAERNGCAFRNAGMACWIRAGVFGGNCGYKRAYTCNERNENIPALRNAG